MNDIKMNILIDTNVLIDALLNRSSNHFMASQLLLECIKGDAVKGFITSHSLTDFFYITRKDLTIQQRINFFKLILSAMVILTEDNQDFISTINDKNFFDLEDGLQMTCAKKANLDFIVTENLKDFQFSEIPAVSTKAFIKTIY